MLVDPSEPMEEILTLRVDREVEEIYVNGAMRVGAELNPITPT
jgi:predicted HicB family RNase H-like nuclease